MDLEAFRWLLTDPGQDLLARAAERVRRPRRRPGPDRHGPAPAALDVTPEHAAAALTQVDLRARAGPKLGDDAARMYFTPDGLEQATRAPRRAAPCGPGRVRLPRLGARPRLRHRRRPGRARARRADRGRHRPRRAARRGGPREPRGARARRGGAGRGGRGRRRLGLRRGLRRPRPSYGSGAGVRRRRLVAAVGLRAALLPAAVGRQGRARASRTTCCPTGVEAEWVSDEGDVKEAALWSPQLAVRAAPARR